MDIEDFLWGMFNMISITHSTGAFSPDLGLAGAEVIDQEGLDYIFNLLLGSLRMIPQR